MELVSEVSGCPDSFPLPPPTALLYKPIDRVTRSTLVLHVSVKTLSSQGGVQSSVGARALGGRGLVSPKAAIWGTRVEGH